MPDKNRRGRPWERNGGMEEMDIFGDAELERLLDKRDAGARGSSKRPVNLTSRIEDYLRTRY
ncbi:MAG: hypothetical protein WCO52_03670 [bacterium]